MEGMDQIELQCLYIKKRHNETPCINIINKNAFKKTEIKVKEVLSVVGTTGRQVA
jgi:hypothetical protein